LFRIRQKIKFYSKHFSLLEKPIPSKKKVPLWYKKMQNFPMGKKESGSVKRCVPFLDALTSGYYIVNNFEVLITWREPGVLDIRYNQNLEITKKEQKKINLNQGLNLFPKKNPNLGIEGLALVLT